MRTARNDDAVNDDGAGAADAMKLTQATREPAMECQRLALEPLGLYKFCNFDLRSP